MNYIHASAIELELGTVLEFRMRTPQYAYQMDVIASALLEGPSVLKAIMLSEVLRTNGDGMHMSRALREWVTENIRVLEFPDRPSRLEAIFLSPSVADAATFRRITGSDRQHLDVCSVTDDAPFLTNADHIRAIVPLAPIEQQLDFLEQQARRYWNSDTSDEPIPEVLAKPGTVQVTARTEWP